MSAPSGGGSTPGSDIRALIPSLLRGYPPVLGAMLLVEGVITVILGGDATISLGEVVAYLLLPPLAMYLVTQFTGGRRPAAVAIGTAVAGAVVVLLALFLGGGVHLLTLPGWALAVMGLLLLGVAVFVMRLSAPGPEENVAPLLSESERDDFTQHDEFGNPTQRRDGYPAAGGDYGSARHSAPADEYGSPDEYVPTPHASGYGDPGAAQAGYGGPGAAQAGYGDPGAAQAGYGDSGAAQGGYGDRDRSSEFDWPPARRDEASPYRAGHSAGDGGPSAVAATGPSEPEWPPRRATHSAGPAEMEWSGQPAAAAAEPEWGSPSTAAAEPEWTQGPSNRDWPPAPSVHEWPPRRESEPTEPAPDGAPRSWFDPDPEPEPGGPTGPTDREWPPANPDSSGGRRSRYQ